MTDEALPSSRALPDLLAGRYRIVSRIGVGGMGVVYKALDLQLNRTVAIKALEDRRLHLPGAAGRLRTEAMAAASLDHPYICKIYELIETENETFIVMEFVEGETLTAMLKRGTLPLAQTLQLGREIAEGLANAHARGLVHRDVKPSNVMVTPHGHVKLLDFGVAGTDVASTPADRTHTVSPQFTMHAGTPQYMAPEQASGAPVTARADLFSLGVLLYECVTGQLPFTGATTFDYVRHLMQSPPRRLDRVAPDTPSDLVDLVEQCLEKVPAARPDSAAAVVKALRRMSDALTSPGASLRSAGQVRSGRRWKWAAVTAVGIAIVAVGWQFTGGGGDSGPVRQLRPFVTSAAQESGSRISPDGQWVSFVSSSAGASQIMVQRIDGGEPRPLTLGRGTPVSQVWSPDGKELACVLAVDDGFVLQRYPAFFGGAPEQSIAIKPSLNGVKLLRWLGRTIYLEAQQATGLSLRRLDLDASSDTGDLSGAWKIDGTLRGVDVRPDGRGVAMSVIRDGQEDLWLADMDGSHQRPLTTDLFFDRAPLWNGRGDRVMFQSNRGGQIDLWEIDPESGATTQLTSGEMEKIAESTSTDGSIISFQRLSQDAKLWAWSTTGRTGQQLTQDALSDYSPAVAANGRMVVFQRSQPVPSRGYAIMDSKLFVGPLDPRVLADQARPVTDGFAPSLSPNAEWLAYLQTAGRASRTSLLVRQLASGATTTVSTASVLPILSMLPVDWASGMMTWNAAGTSLFFVDQPDVATLRRYQVGAATADSPIARTTTPAELMRDLHVSPDGAWIAFLTISREATIVHSLSVATGEDRQLARLPSAFTGIYARGWLDDSLVLVRIVARHEDRSADIEVFSIDRARRIARIGVVTNAFIATSRLHAPTRTLYITRADGGVHNLYAFSLETTALKPLTQNTLPGVTFSGFVPVGADTVVGAREERRQDIWLIQASTKARSGNSAGR